MARNRENKIELTAYDDLFETDESRAEANLSKIREIPISEIDEFPDHPFKVLMNEDMEQLVESVSRSGVMTPATVRQKEDGRYELISGHRRKKACELAGLETLKCEVKELTHDETVVMLSHKKPDSVINVKVEFGEGEGKVPLDNIAKRAEAYKPKERVTYKMIKEYIEAKYGFKVHTAYIAEVKRDLGLPMYDAPNAVEELKQPRKHPTAEKAEAIKDALKHFEVI